MPTGLWGIILWAMALVASWAMTPIAGAISRKLGVIDNPNSRKVHVLPTPKAGGLAIAVATLLVGSLALVVLDLDSVLMFRFLTAASLVSVVGWLDDKFDLKPKYKLMGLAVPAIWWVVGLRTETPTSLLMGSTEVLFIVVASNAFNLIDGLDGLAAGVGGLSALFLSLLGVALGQPDLIVLGLILAGASFGFLRHNYQPAWIFMGDTGSLFMGFSLSALSLVAAEQGLLSSDLPLALGALVFPLYDTTITIARRLVHKRPIFQADKSHTYNLLVVSGYSVKQTVFLCYGSAVIAGLLALVYASSSVGWVRLLSVISVLSLLVLVTLRFDFLKVDD